MRPSPENFKPQQKLVFYRQHHELNPVTRKNDLINENLFAEWVDLRPASAFKTMNGVQTDELAFTHTVMTRWLSRIDIDMFCYVRERMPDGSIQNKSFKVVGYEPWQQSNIYMLVKLSELKS